MGEVKGPGVHSTGLFHLCVELTVSYLVTWRVVFVRRDLEFRMTGDCRLAASRCHAGGRLWGKVPLILTVCSGFVSLGSRVPCALGGACSVVVADWRLQNGVWAKGVESLLW